MSNSLEHVVPSSPTQSTLLSLQSKEEAYNIQLSYWKQQLNGVQPVLELPVDHPISPVQTFQRATYRFMLSNNLSEALRTISQQQEGALFVTLLAAFQTLLFRYTGQEDLVVGLPVASRNQVEVEGVSNAFVNMLPLRCDLSGNLRFRELLHQVHKVVSEAHAHQDLPFEDLIRELKLEQDLSRNRLVQIIFTLQNTSVSSPRSIDLALRQVEIANGIAQYDVALVMTDTAQGLIGELQYNAKLFEAATIARMLGHFQTLMESIVADPEQRLAELPLLTAAERQQLLADWNATEAEYPKDQCVHQLFEAQVERTPDAVAVISEEQQLTYHDLNVQANQLAHHLRTLGVGPEVLVGLCVERSLEMIVGLLGILKAGGAYVPLDPAYPSERLAFMLQDTQVGVLLTQQRLVENLPDHKAKVICLDTGWEANAESVANPFNEVAGDNLAYVIYTSGSTGKPKGVPITQQNLIHSTYTRMIYYPTVIKCLLLSTLAFDISGAAIFWTLCQGGTLILPQQDLEQDPSQIAEVIAHRQVSHMLCISSLYSLLLTQAQHGQLRSLQVVIVGGESGPRDLPERHSALLPDTTLFNEYGLTEGAVWSSVYEIGLQGLGTTIPIGQPIANVQIYLLDRHLQPVPIGIPGELYIGGEGLARGYLHRPELTAERFIPHPFSTEPGARLYKTGDLARYRADGTIEFLGRLDQQVKLRGYRIELGEIEALLSQHPAVRECLVLVREAGVDDKRLVAYLLPEQAEQTPSLGELRSYLQAKLPEYMVPTAFVEVEAWPLTPNGKIDRRALPAPQRTAAAGANSALAPRTPLEEVLLGMWAQVLGVEQVGLHDNFFELGGHSLLAMQVVWRVREALQVELPLNCLFETPTVAQLAQHLQTSSPTRASEQVVALEPVVRPEVLPLSFAQQRLWFLEQWEPESPLYNIPLALRLRGALEVAILEQSLSEILRRHEALRTSFAIKEGQAVQVIAPVDSLPLPVTDLSALPQEQREALARRIASQEAQRPFALARAPLLRAQLLRLAPQEHVLLLTMHHIVSDDWSIQVLLRELSALYAAYGAGQPSPLPPLPIQYADYALWQRQWLQGEVLEDQLTYWQQQLAGAPALLELPTDRPRPAVQTFRGALHHFELPKPLSQGLKKLSQGEGVTLFMTLLAAFHTLLWRYTGQADLVVGTPIANRTRAEIEGLIGFFVNTLALRADLSGDPSFRQLLVRVRQVALGAYAHPDVPFERVVEAVQPERSLSHSPLFQVVFALDHLLPSSLVLGEVTGTFQPVESGMAKFDLTMNLVDSEQGLIGVVEYNSELFEAATITRLIGHFQTLLEGLVANPEQRLAELPLLTEAELQELLVERNATQIAYPEDSCLQQLIEDQVERTPEAVAVVFKDTQLTYRELNARANQLAHYLRQLGVGPEVLVGLCMERCLEMVVGLLGILKAGGAYVPLDPSYPAERIAFMLTDAQAPVLITQQHLTEHLPAHHAQVVCLDADVAVLGQQSETNLIPVTTSGNLAYVIYTSGSTGRPKGVQILHRAVVNFLMSMRQQPGLVAEDTLLAITTLSFDIAALELFLPLIVGARFIVASRDVVTNATGLAETLALSHATVMQATPVTWRMLLAAQWQGNQHLKILCGGEALPSELAQQLLPKGASLCNLYGPTETTIWSAARKIEPEDKVITVGRPIANTQVYLLDAQLQLVPVGIPGELYIGGEGLARGYLHRPELTAERFIPHPFSTEPGARLYKTGDLARYRADGTIEHLGRLDQQVKLRGYRIELGEIEALLSQHPAVRECLVLVREAGVDDKRLVAYLLPEQAEQTPSLGELRSYLQAKLPEYMVPTAFVEVEAWPLTPNGKIDRRALPAPQRTVAAGASSALAPRTPLEEVLLGIWAQVLGEEQVGLHDNFFELGGHSLLAMQVVWRVREALQVELPLSCLFETPTVAQVAQRLQTLSQTTSSEQIAALEPVVRPEVLPLSFAQQRLWFLEQWEPESPLYNLPLALRLRGPLEVAILEQSLNEILRRHEALRTSFAIKEGQAVQVIAPVDSLPLPVTDLSGLPQEQREALARRIASQEAQRPFALAQAPLLRAQLLRLAPQEHVLLLTMHHIVSDDWSMQVLFGELSALYKAYGAGQASPLPELPLQYADYALWQRQWLQGEVLEGQLTYWQQQLAGAPALLELPTDRPRPAVQTFRGALHHFELPKPLSQGLKKLSQGEGVTLFMTLLAAFHTLLWRYTGQADLVVGTPIANRTRAEIEGLIGFFVNTLALRADLSGDPSFRQLLTRVRQVALGAYAHPDVPFERVVEAVQPERSLSHSPLFQVVFALDHLLPSSLVLGEVTGTFQPVESGMAKFDLTMNLIDSEQGLIGEVEYNSDLFEAATIRRMLGHFQTLLEGLVANPEQRLSALPLLREAERQQLLAEWNATQTAYPKEICIHELFEAQVQQRPEALAVVWEGKQLSYKQLNQRANQLAHYLQRHGVGPEVRVGLCMERCLEMVVGLFGILKAGGAYVPLDPVYPQERLAFMLADAQVPVLLTQQRLLARLPTNNAQVICLDADDETFCTESTTTPLSGVGPGNLAYVIYTSGSTGRPKGTLLAHQGLCNLVQAQIRAFGACPDGRVLQFASLSFDASIWEIVMALGEGATLCLAPSQALLAGPDLLRLLQQQHITAVTLPPSVLAGLPVDPCPALKTIITAGEACPAELVASWGAEHCFFNAYGPTEVTVCATVAACHPESGRPPIGWPIANTQVYVLDRQLQLVPVGVPGELYIGGEGLARGYLHRPELTAERFIPHPFSTEPGGRLYKTGDLARYRPDGSLEFLGRLDQQVKLRGYRIELGEIEALLSQHPAVRECLVLVREEGSGDKRLVAYLLPADAEARASGSALRSYLQAKLPEYMVPTAFVEVEAWPLTPNGKIDRRALPAPQRTAAAGASSALAPRTPLEEVLLGMWAHVLGVEQVGLHDNFFELGGHSLLAMQVVWRVREALQVELPLSCLFEMPTVAQLAQHLQTCGPTPPGEQVVPLEPVVRPLDLPLSFAQQRLWFLEQWEPESPLYNLPLALRLRGALKVAILEQSLSEILRRHEALRTSFAIKEGQAVQVIAPVDSLPLPITDLSGLPQEQREALARRIASQEAQRPFALAQAPLLRAQLLRLAPQEHVLLLTMHHIISDEWSLQILLRELSALYTAYGAGQPSPLADLPLQYADYALWQRQWLQGEVLEGQLTYWQQQLAGAPALLELPTDRPRPAVQTFRGALHHFELPKPLSQGLKKLSQEAGVTLFMTLLAAFQTLLWRYTGQADLVVGTPIANRTRAEIEGLIGFFVNTLALRADLSGDPSFRQLLGRVRQVALGAYAHQDVPFERVVEAVQPHRDPSRNPLFQVMFALQNAPMETLGPTDLALNLLQVESGTAKFDVSLFLTEVPEGLIGELEYNTDLFDLATIRRLASHFQTMLEGIVANPAQRLSALPLLTEAERQQVLAEWNATQTAYPKEVCIHELFEAQVERTPEALAVVWEGKQLSYKQLNQRANQLAHYLQRHGVGPEVRVGLCMERCLEMVVGLLGILKAGGAYVPLDPAYPQERLAFMLTDAQVPVLLTQQSLVEDLPDHQAKVVCLDTGWEALAKESKENLANTVTPDNLAYVIYTSGSTGRPKGAMILHRGLVNYLSWCTQAYEVGVGKGSPVHSPLGFDLTVTSLFSPLLVGQRVVLLPENQRAEALPEALRDGANFSLVKLTPSHVQLLNQSLPSEEAAGSARALIIGGEALLAEQLAFWREHAPHTRLINEYGPTETVVGCCVYEVAPDDPAAGPVPIGRPIANTQLYILDGQLQLVPVGVPGELYIGGEGLARGYLHRPELTAERFLPHPWSAEPGARLYKTGDLARYRLDGSLEFLGRLDQQVKLRGYRIELGEIEALLSQHPAVRECLVLMREAAMDGKRLVAYLLPEQAEQKPSQEELRNFLQAQLPEYMVPTAFVGVDAWPLTPNGKIDRRALPAPQRVRSQQERAFEEPMTAAERLLADIWRQLLGLDKVGIHDNFFELGGDSILGLRVIARANEMGLRFTLKQLFQYQTIAQLAAEADLVSNRQAEQDIVTGPVPLTPIQHWFFEQRPPDLHHWNQAVLLEVQYELDPGLLEQALQALLVHHDALRLRFQPIGSQWQQRNSRPGEQMTLTTMDLTRVPEAEQESAMEKAATELHASLNIAEGPLIRVALLRLSAPKTSRLLIVIHHLAVDIVSWQILLEDLETAYQQLRSGQAVQLPAKTTSFRQWAQKLEEYAQSEQLRQECDYWLNRAWTSIGRFPVDHPAGVNTEDSACTVSVALSVQETQALLQQVPKRYHTQANDALLTALVLAYSRWTGERSLLIDLEGHGREDIAESVDLSRTVGWFTAMAPVILDLSDTVGPGESLKAVKEQLRAIPHGGIGYGLLRYLSRDGNIVEQMRLLPRSEVIFNYHGRSAQALSPDTLFRFAPESSGPAHSLQGRRSHLLDVEVTLEGDCLYIHWVYSQNLHARSSIERLAQMYKESLQSLIDHCQSPEAGGYTPSDFPEADLSQEELDRLIAEFSISQESD